MGNAYSSREAVSPIKVIIWNKQPRMRFQMLVLYDWRFTDYQFVLALNTLKLTIRDLFLFATEPSGSLSLRNIR
jgi:hypothetical protein